MIRQSAVLRREQATLTALPTRTDGAGQFSVALAGRMRMRPLATAP